MEIASFGGEEVFFLLPSSYFVINFNQIALFFLLSLSQCVIKSVSHTICHFSVGLGEKKIYGTLFAQRSDPHKATHKSATSLHRLLNSTSSPNIIQNAYAHDQKTNQQNFSIAHVARALDS